jgi:DNA modification methylase
MKKVPGYLDRYPAKMVTTLADKIISSYVEDNSVILDPFCGSGAILKAAIKKNCQVYGMDINPYAILLSSVKLKGFDIKDANNFLEIIISECKKTKSQLATTLQNMNYWFTPKTLEKLNKLRYHLHYKKAANSKEGQAVLLAFALTIRRVSRADQRSPKPFISKVSIERTKGRHLDPYIEIIEILEKLSGLYGDVVNPNNIFLDCADCTNSATFKIEKKSITHIITSPPYINAQDYFRNSKLELFFLEGILNFNVLDIKQSFIGTESGSLAVTKSLGIEKINRVTKKIGNINKRLSLVVLKYFSDMNAVFDNTYDLLGKNGKLVLVCGDNVVCGKHIETWQVLNNMAEMRGYKIIDHFKDKILNRSLAPSRMGHKSFIKDESVTVFLKN